ncbi:MULTISPECIES: 3'-5' exonuclease [Serratia]|uniref:3'-5' exonuclease n=1 Tax=Serratia TaxID=613 RepID=UPI000CF5DF73|nr:3'-5' exonuclease [Serratia rhizosphaerae]AVJ18298.1 hypothetical protein CLM71_14695 [Serratia sp. MYb239]
MTPQQSAKHWLDKNFLILDTETTGLGDDAEIVEISIIDCAGNVLVDTLVKPSKPIPVEATKIHGITNEMVASAHSWPFVFVHQVAHIIAGREIVIYNADYDIRLIKQSCEITNMIGAINIPSHCAMLAYAEFYGQKGNRGGYKWQKLTNAAAQQGVIIEGTPHRALSDCLTTLGVIKTMAGKSYPEPVTRIMDELDHAAEAAAWEPRVYNAVVRAKQIIQCQQKSNNNFKVKFRHTDQHIHELETENATQRRRIEHLEQYKAGVISIVNACNEAHPSPVPFSEDDFLRIVDLIKIDDIPFGAENADQDIIAAQERLLGEQATLLQQAKEKEQKLEKCLGLALAFMKGAAADVSFVDWLEKTADNLTTKERNK